MKHQILFVDDEPMILQGLQRMLRNMRDRWDMRFTAGGAEALVALAKAPADLIVTDMRMPGMDGAQLLREVARLYPSTIRFVLTGQADRELIIQSLGTAHQFLGKPCDAATLIATITRAFAFDRILPSAALRRIVSAAPSLPSPPEVHRRLGELVVSSDASMESVGKVLSADPSMTAKVLQTVNSTFFGLGRTVTNPTDAAILLGVETLRALVLFRHVFEMAPANWAVFSKELAHHSLNTGRYAARLMALENRPTNLQETSLTAGLLHDIGKIILAINIPKKMEEVREMAASRGVSEWMVELEVLGTTHAEVGAYLLGLWGLPFDLVEAVAFHHRPHLSGNNEFSTLTAVHVANAFERNPGAAVNNLDSQYLDQIGLAARTDEWRGALAVKEAA